MSTPPPDDFECIICMKPIQIFAVHHCGHFCCHMCALRMRKMGKDICPICRLNDTKLYLTTSPTLQDECTIDMSTFDPDKLYYDKDLNTFYESYAILNSIDLLRRNFCPRKECWPGGKQEPFIEFSDLKGHLWHAHGLSYCEVCLKHKPAFLCEQTLYLQDEMDSHMKGECEVDEPSFTGHIYCHFCKIYLYDVDLFVVHMRDQHMTCDICHSKGFPNRYFHNSTTMYRHFEKDHHVCRHPECSDQDMMLRVFGSELELHTHFSRCHNVKSGRRVPMGLEAFGFRYGNDAQNLEGQTEGPDAAATRANTVTFDFGTNRKEISLLKGQRGNRRNPQGSESFISNLAAQMPNAHITRSHRNENARLWATLRTYLGSEDRLFQFRQKCTDFLNGTMRAAEYHAECRAAFGKNMDKVFPKLVELLPDSMKREALLAIQNTVNTTELGKAEPPSAPQASSDSKAQKKTQNKPVDPRYRKAVMSGTSKEREEKSAPVPGVNTATVDRSAATLGLQSITHSLPRGQWQRPPAHEEASSMRPSPGLNQHVDVLNLEDFPSLSEDTKRAKAKPKPKNAPPNSWSKGNLAAKLAHQPFEGV